MLGMNPTSTRFHFGRRKANGSHLKPFVEQGRRIGSFDLRAHVPGRMLERFPRP